MRRRPRGGPAGLRLDATSFVAPGAVVVGDVTLGARSSVWFHSVLRGDTAPIVVGEETNIQDGSVVHVDEGQPARIGARVTIGHGSVVHGCVVEDECLIGMGSVILSGARVGGGSLVGAGSLVREGQRLPPRSLVLGVPARVVGVLSAARRTSIRRGAAHYVELSQTYLRRGFGRPFPLPGLGLASAEPGPMTFREWGQLLAVLAESPSWVGQQVEDQDPLSWGIALGSGRWNPLQVLCHLRDRERQVYLPRTQRVLTEENPRLRDVEARARTRRGDRPRDIGRVLAMWRTTRATLLGRLSPLGPPEWARTATDPVRGPLSLGQMVRDWVEHDLAQRRLMAAAFEDRA
ncbi:MAG TPA: DinB family protein [Candidatus Eisenbacteria bacterium]|jgi:carbonic anhydrase/acetyltransferase-like protein (isoleucine patch superfamily)